MKTLICMLVSIFFLAQVNAQNRLFVRVFSPGHKKISKGYIHLATDSSLQLYNSVKNPVYRSVHFSDIGYIKTKRSGWINIMAGSVATSAGMAIGGAVTTKPDDFLGKRFAATVLGIIGLPIGAALGAATIPLNKSKRFVVNGDIQNWNNFITYYRAMNIEK